jgi:lysylphosphatidylglycerol synthetase-like protein (DUF2156 family)
MSKITRALRLLTSLRFIYSLLLAIALLTVVLVYFGEATPAYYLRGNGNAIIYISTWVIALVVIVILLMSNLSRVWKIGLVVVHSAAFLCFSCILYLAFSFSLNCTIGFDSPSGKKSITIEDNCFIDCHNYKVFSKYFIFQKQIGLIKGDFGGVCGEGKNTFQIKWKADESEIEWKAVGIGQEPPSVKYGTVGTFPL